MNINKQKNGYFPSSPYYVIHQQISQKTDWLQICDGQTFDVNQFPE